MKKLHSFLVAAAVTVAAIPVASAHDSFHLGINIGGGFPYYAPPVRYYAAPPVVYYSTPTVYYAAPPAVIYRGNYYEGRSRWHDNRRWDHDRDGDHGGRGGWRHH